VNFDTVVSLSNQLAESKTTFSSNTINCDTLTVTDINGKNFDTDVVQKIDTINTNVSDLSQNIYNDLSVVSLNATGQVKENNLPLNYTQTFSLASGMNTTTGSWGSNSYFDYKTSTFTITKTRSDVNCFEVYKSSNQMRFRLTSNAYAGVWRVDMKFIINNTGALGNFTSILTRTTPTSQVKTINFIPALATGMIANQNTHNVYDTFSVNSTSQSFYIQTLFDGATTATTTSSFSITEFHITFTYLGSELDATPSTGQVP
jgi:hypothetical protein